MYPSILRKERLSKAVLNATEIVSISLLNTAVGHLC
jgi:hypothetical protein